MSQEAGDPDEYMRNGHKPYYYFTNRIGTNAELKTGSVFRTSAVRTKKNMLTKTSILSMLPFYEYFSGGEVGFSKSFDVVSFDFEKENPSFIS